MDAADLPPHDPFKNVVDTVQDLAPAAEVLVQIDPLGAGIQRPVGVKFFHKNFRPGQTEFIDALFDVAHHKAVVASFILRGYGTQQQFLDIVAVLILIDQDLGKVPAVFHGSRPGRTGSVFMEIQQDLQGVMLQIREVQQVLFPLGLAVAFRVGQGQIDQLPQGTVRRPHGMEDQIRGAFRVLSADGSDFCLYGRASVFDPVLLAFTDVGISFLSQGRKPAEGSAAQARDQVPDRLCLFRVQTAGQLQKAAGMSLPDGQDRFLPQFCKQAVLFQSQQGGIAFRSVRLPADLQHVRILPVHVLQLFQGLQNTGLQPEGGKDFFF